MNIFFPFSSVSNQTYLLRKNRYQLTVFDRLNSYAGTFDVVVSRNLLWTIPHPDTAVKNWKKVLKKGGVLIVIDGLYNGGLIERKTRQFISDFLTLLIERRYPRRRQYFNEIKNELPNPNGVPPEKTFEYFRKAGFKNVKDLDLKEIAKIQMKKCLSEKE